MIYNNVENKNTHYLQSFFLVFQIKPEKEAIFSILGLILFLKMKKKTQLFHIGYLGTSLVFGKN